MTASIDASAIFETEVRRVASALFPRARSLGPIKIDGRERDGVYNDGDIIHIVEATIERRTKKVRDDLEKSTTLVKSLRRQHPNINFKIWILTKFDPTADQAALANQFRKDAKCPIEVISYQVFSAKLVDAARYLELRQRIAFGSVRNPENDKDINVPDEDYISLDLLDPLTDTITSVSALVSGIPDRSGVFILIGDFGTGKSMTLRHVYRHLQNSYLAGHTTKFPIYLNLRSHFGQSDPAEALIRHGNEVGLPEPNQLVAAWRAGHAHVFLDGFDELSSTRFARGFRGLRQARREATRLVNSFVMQHPGDASLFISGRQHYFDSIDELKRALGISSDARFFSLSEFSNEQIQDYLKKKGFRQDVPNWLPARPLLLGYLVVKGILSEISNDLTDLSREVGWDYLLNRICEREARQIDPVTIEPTAVREFVERLATLARKLDTGRGPLQLTDIHTVFQEIFAMQPDEKAEVMIFRMPGVTTASGQEDALDFIDDDYVDACRARDVCRYVAAPHDVRLSGLGSAVVQMGDLGCSMAAERLRAVTQKQLTSALGTAADHSFACLGIDIVRIMQQLGVGYSGPAISFRDGFYDSFDVISGADFSQSYFHECSFLSVDIESEGASGPIFEGCLIGKVFGAITAADLPKGVFVRDTQIEAFSDDAGTNADILDLPLPLSIKVMMTILRTLFVQPGRGRKDSALYRGLDNRATAYVPDILAEIQHLGFAKPHRINGPIVWIPNRTLAHEAYDILRAPQQSTHKLVQAVKQL